MSCPSLPPLFVPCHLLLLVVVLLLPAIMYLLVVNLLLLLLLLHGCQPLLGLLALWLQAQHLLQVCRAPLQRAMSLPRSGPPRQRLDVAWLGCQDCRASSAGAKGGSAQLPTGPRTTKG